MRNNIDVFTLEKNLSMFDFQVFVNMLTKKLTEEQKSQSKNNQYDYSNLANISIK